MSRYHLIVHIKMLYKVPFKPFSKGPYKAQHKSPQKEHLDSNCIVLYLDIYKALLTM